MLNTLSIKNFRGFRDLTVEPLDRVNLIAGKNNVGKTALLEAVYLLLASNLPEGTGPIGLLRGFEDLRISSVDKWRWLFHKENFDARIILSAINDEVTRTLSIRWNAVDREWLALPVNVRRKAFPTTTFSLELQYADSRKIQPYKPTIITLTSNPDHSADKGQTPPFPIAMISSTFKHSPREHAQIYSELVAQGRQELIFDTLRLMEPRLARLSVLVLTDIPMVYAELDSKELIPIAQMGEGVGRIFSLLLNIASVEGGILLIDEIENGLHHSVMPDVWKAIAIAARSADVQIFATTHSWECIQAAHEAFSKSDRYDFRLHRLDRVGDDVEAVTYDKETLETSVTMGLEVR
jgi:hypothetical protein